MSDEPTLPQRFGRAVSSGDLETVRQLLQMHPELATKDRLDYHLRRTSGDNNVAMMSLLVDLGADINAPDETSGDPEGCINQAADCGAVDAVRWLLDRGAKINHTVNSVARCFPLSGASFGGHLEVVKLLVENGADINATWNKQNALCFAIMYGKKDVEAYLRSKGARTPAEIQGKAAPKAAAPKAAAENNESLLIAHITEYYGAPEPLALREIVPCDPSIAIHVVQMSGGKALITVGMSSKPMTVPEGSEELQYAELMIYLPDNWPLDEASLRNPNNYWPIEWLRRIAMYPHQNHTWLGGNSVVFANDEPPKPLAANTRLTCFLALTSDDDEGRMVRADGSQVVFYSLYPLYTEERDFEKTKGTIKLLELFQKHGIGTVVDLRRPNVAMKQTKKR
jgi:hypothetical protein